MSKRVKNKLKKMIMGMKGAQLQTGSQIYCSVEIQNAKGVRLGQNTILYKNCNIYNSPSGTIELGNNSHVAPYGYFLIGENSVKIGNDVAIGPFCSFFCMSNSPKGDSDLFRENYTYGNISIGNNVFIGSHSTILPGSVVQDNVVIGANSVVSGELESGWIYGGSPAKKIKKVKE